MDSTQISNRLTLAPHYEDKTSKKMKPIPNRDVFSAMLNPEETTVMEGIENYFRYTGGMLQKCQKLTSPTIHLPSLILDATGAIPKELWPKNCDSIKDMIECLKNATILPYGEAHQSPIVQLHWCGMIFTTRVTKLTTKYTLFDINGLPLRAEVTLELAQYFSRWPYEEKKSPDLTHLVVVKAGDSLPLMCERVYNDSSYYLQVARINGLTDFRRLKPGMTLEFPPIRE